MKRFMFIFSIIFLLTLNGCCQNHIREERTKVVATVSKTAASDGKKLTYFPQSQSNLVTVNYNNLSQTFNNELLYQTFDEGDKIYMIVYNIYDEHDNIIRQELLLP